MLSSAQIQDVAHKLRTEEGWRARDFREAEKFEFAVCRKQLTEAIPAVQKWEGMVARAQLTLLVAGVQRCDSLTGVMEVLDSWITANDLEPEKVEHFDSIEGVLAYFERKEDKS